MHRRGSAFFAYYRHLDTRTWDYVRPDRAHRLGAWLPERARSFRTTPDVSGALRAPKTALELEGGRPPVSVWLRIVVSEQFETLGGVFIDVRSVHRDVSHRPNFVAVVLPWNLHLLFLSPRGPRCCFTPKPRHKRG